MPIKHLKMQSPIDDHCLALFEQSPVSIQIMSPDGQIIQVNKAWEELWGVTLDQLEGYNIFRDEQLEKNGVMPYIKSAFDGQFAEIPPVLYDPDKTIPNITRHAEPKRWTKAIIYSIKNSDGQVQEVILLHEDITAQKQAEEKIKASELRYFSLLENASDMIYTHDLQGNCLSINSAGEKTTGYSLEELKKMNIVQLIVPEHLELARQMIERKSHDNTPTIYELDIITKDGRRLMLEVNSRISSTKEQPLAVEGIISFVMMRATVANQMFSGNIGWENTH
jgi:PAS domain S-box-containing protein